MTKRTDEKVIENCKHEVCNFDLDTFEQVCENCGETRTPKFSDNRNIVIDCFDDEFPSRKEW